MVYYRMALRNRQTATWRWQTTVLTSLQAVLQLLRSYSTLPQDSIRMFTAASKEDLNEMLKRENTNLVSGSVTAAQFLRERLLHVPGQAQSAAEHRAVEPAVRQTMAIATSSSPREHPVPTGFPGGMDSLERKRLERECGPGSDHDTPYHFTLPVSTPQLLAWMLLQIQVQTGKLQP
jgi:hypothetical protein